MLCPADMGHGGALCHGRLHLSVTWLFMQTIMSSQHCSPRADMLCLDGLSLGGVVCSFDQPRPHRLPCTLCPPHRLSCAGIGPHWQESMAGRHGRCQLSAMHSMGIAQWRCWCRSRGPGASLPLLSEPPGLFSWMLLPSLLGKAFATFFKKVVGFNHAGDAITAAKVRQGHRHSK